MTRVASLRVTIIFPVMLILFAVLSVGSILFSRYRQSRVVRESKKASGRQALGLFGFCQTDNGPVRELSIFQCPDHKHPGSLPVLFDLHVLAVPGQYRRSQGLRSIRPALPGQPPDPGQHMLSAAGLFKQIWRRGDFGLSRVPLVTIRRVAIYICGMALYL